MSLCELLVVAGLPNSFFFAWSLVLSGQMVVLVAVSIVAILSSTILILIVSLESQTPSPLSIGIKPVFQNQDAKLTLCFALRRGVIDRVGPSVTNLKVGDKVVVSFQVACGTCRYCKKKYSSMCENTNNSSLMGAMYGQRDAGFLGYGHLSE